MTELSVGVVGAAGLRSSMLRLFDAHQQAETTAICDTDSEGLESAAAELGPVESYVEYETMLNKADLDVVFLSTPQSAHAPQATAALERDIHVFSEVAAASSLEQARKLVAANEDSNAQYMMGENTRYFREHVLVEALVREGLFGDLYYAEGMYLHDLKELTERTPWRRRELMGTPGITYPTHQIGPVLQWFGDDRITEVSCRGSGNHYQDAAGIPYEADDTSVLLCRTEQGRLVTIRQDVISNRPPPKRLNQYQLQGTSGCFLTAQARRPGSLKEVPDMVWFEDLHETPNPHDREFTDISEFEQYLPERYRNPPEMASEAEHFGADYYCVTDFIESVVAGDPIPIDIHDAMDMTLPGIASRESSSQNGEWLGVPDSRAW